MVRYANTHQRQLVLVMLVGHQSVQRIAEATGLSLRSCQRYKRLFDLTGDPFPRPKTSQNACVLQPWMMDRLLEHLCVKPDLYLDEMQWFLLEECHVWVHKSTISRQLDKAGWKKKKNQIVAAQRNPVLRNDWLRKIGMFTGEMFVFCDESGTDRRDGVRRTGWAPPGVKPFIQGKFERGTRFHLLPAITADGILDLLVYKGQSNKEGFVAWLTDCVLPKMNRFPDRNSILVMDNASWHHGDEITHACHAAGILLWYLPPYSPDFNPIEAMFSDIKRMMKREYKHRDGDLMLESEFKDFLQMCAESVGEKGLRGHYRNSMLSFMEDSQGIDYYSRYTSELAALLYRFQYSAGGLLTVVWSFSTALAHPAKSVTERG